MKKKSLMLLLSIPFVFALGGIAACEEEEVVCDHTYADELSSDEDYHWYAATCDHTDLRGDAEPHKDKDNDGVCDVCEYDADHEHTYEETLTSNETQHWYAAKCTHSVKKDAEDHDFDEVGICKDCGYSEDAGHQHTFKNVYSTSATQHWFDSKCDHPSVVVKENHVDEDNNNVCDVCGYNTYDLSTVIATATSAASAAKVSSTELNYSNPYDYCEISEDERYAYDYAYTFTYGVENYAKKEMVKSYTSATYDYGIWDYVYNTVEVSKENTYYSMVDEDNIFALVEDFGEDLTVAGDDTLERDKYAVVSEIVGPQFSVSILSDNAYGVENMLAELYSTAMTSNLVFNYANGENVEDDITYYWINFLYITESGYGYDYQIEFSLEDGVINKLSMVIGEYGESDLVANYDYETKEMEYLLKDYATPFQETTYEVTQTIGERTAVVPDDYDMDNYLLTSFKISDGTNEYENGATVTTTTGSELTFSISGDGVTDKVAFNNVTFSGNLPGYEWDGTWKLASYSNTKGGTYTFTASTDIASVTITVVIEWQTLTSLSVHQDSAYGYQEVTTATVYAGKEFVFKPVANSGANNEVTVAVTGTGITSDDYTLSYSSPDYIFTATKTGTYTITLTSTIDVTITATVTVTVAEAPNVGAILSGAKKYEDYYGYIQFAFTPASANATNGTVVITGSYYDRWGTGSTYTINKTVNYVYDETANEIALSGEESEQFELMFDEDFNLIGGWYYQYSYDQYWQYGIPYNGQLITVVADPA